MRTHVVQCPDCLGFCFVGTEANTCKNTCARCMGLGKVPAHDGIAEWVGWCPALHEFMGGSAAASR